MGYPKLYFDNRFSDAPPVASSTAAGNFNAANVADMRPYTWWKPAALPATLTVTLPGESATAQAATAQSLTLASTANAAQDFYAAKKCIIESGTGAGQSRNAVTSRRNRIRYSTDFSNAAWTIYNLGLGTAPVKTPNFAAAPNGTLTACRIQSALNGGAMTGDWSVINQSLANEGASSLAVSVWLKSNDASTYNVQVRKAANSQTVAVTPTWQKFNLIGSIITTESFYIGLRGASGCSNSCDILAWHPQIENGTEWTEFIATGATPAVGVAVDVPWVTLPDATSTYKFIDADKASDTLLVYGHNLATCGCAVSAYGSDDNFTSQTLLCSAIPASDEPFLVEYPRAIFERVRLSISGTSAPSIAIVMIGSAFQFPVLLTAPYDMLGRKIVGISNNNEDGYPLGSIEKFQRRTRTLLFSNVSWAWLRNVWMAAWDKIKGRPVIFGWDTANYPGEIDLVKVGDSFDTPHRPGSWADLSFPISGVVK